MDRRRFILSGPLILAAGLKSGPRLALAAQFATAGGGFGKVVTVREKAWDSLGRAPDEKLAGEMLERAVRELSGAPSLKEAWARYLSKVAVVGLKPNCLAGRGVSSSPEFVHALARQLVDNLSGLKQVLIWERSNRDLRQAGFEIVSSGSVLCQGNDSLGYSSDLIMSATIGSLYSRAVSDICDRLINLPVLKDHGIVGLSVGMKNYYGAVNNPNKYHLEHGDPYVADLNGSPLIRGKNVLTLCEAYTAQYEGGPPYRPQWAWPAGMILASADPVALDRLGWKMVEDQRKSAGLPSLAQAGREPRYILTAGDKTHSLGQSDLARISQTILS